MKYKITEIIRADGTSYCEVKVKYWILWSYFMDYSSPIGECRATYTKEEAIAAIKDDYAFRKSRRVAKISTLYKMES